MRRCALFLLICCSSVSYAITPDQCTYFQTGAKTAICHATGSPTRPFIVLDLSEQACIAHARHASDFVAVGDPTCQGGQGCLPGNSPCDATLPCCDGLACVNGTCTEASAAAERVCKYLPGNLNGRDRRR